MLRNGTNGQKRKRNPSANASRPARKRNQKVISVPAALGQRYTSGAPSINGMPYGHYRHTELLKDIVPSATGAFSVESIPINPGLPSSFPWLSGCAQNFECYRPVSIKYEFRSLLGSQTAGRVLMGVDYDPADSAPTEKKQLANYTGATSCRAWDSGCTLICNLAELSKVKSRTLRYGPLAANLDIKTFDVGNLWISTFGYAAATPCGELYVHYDIELLTPQMINNSEKAALASAKIVPSAGVDKTHVFGTAATVTGSLAVTAVNNVLTFAQTGQYHIEHVYVGTALVDGGPTMGGSGLSTSKGLGANWVNAAGTGSGYIYAVNIVTPGDTVTVDQSGSNTLTASTTYVTLCNYDL